jgi:Skp family chaperone for outer membrane proteins
MKSYKALLILPLIGILSTPVMAQHGHDGYTNFDQRIERQHKRIKKGVRNDQLTKKEAKKLRKQHRFIKRLSRHFQQDGYLDRYERRTLERELDLASKHIKRLKHNDRYRADNSHKNGYEKKKRYSHYQKDKRHMHNNRSAMLEKKYR